MTLRAAILLQFLVAQAISLPCQSCPAVLLNKCRSSDDTCALMMAALGCPKPASECCRGRECANECCGDDDEESEAVTTPELTADNIPHTTSCCLIRSSYERSAVVVAEKTPDLRPKFTADVGSLPNDFSTSLNPSETFVHEARAGPHHNCSVQSLHCIWLK